MTTPLTPAALPPYLRDSGASSARGQNPPGPFSYSCAIPVFSWIRLSVMATLPYLSVHRNFYIWKIITNQQHLCQVHKFQLSGGHDKQASEMLGGRTVRSSQREGGAITTKHGVVQANHLFDNLTWRHRIKTAGMKRMTFAYSFCGQIGPFDRTMHIDRFQCVLRASRIKSACRRLQRGNEPSIKMNGSFK
jgi:hypothetical protein